MPVSQDNSPLAINTPLGDDVLVISSATISEQQGRLFSMELELTADDPALDFSTVVGGQRDHPPGTRQQQNTLLERLREPFRADRGGRQSGRALSGHAGTLALVPDPHLGLPHLSEHDGARHRHEGVS